MQGTEHCAQTHTKKGFCYQGSAQLMNAIVHAIRVTPNLRDAEFHLKAARD